MLTKCCTMPKLGNRCTGCGHRRTGENGGPPKQTRELAMRNPSFIVSEMVGRHKAKQAGREHLRNLNQVQFADVKSG